MSNKSALVRLQNSVKRHRMEGREMGARAGQFVTGVATGAGLGVLRSKFADPTTGDMDIKGFPVEVGLALGAGAVGMSGYGGKTISKIALDAGTTLAGIYTCRFVESRMDRSKK